MVFSQFLELVSWKSFQICVDRHCSECKEYFFPVEVTLGLPKRYSTGVHRLATRCRGLWSYELAAENLEELAGIRLSHMTVGKIANDTAGEIAVKMNDKPVFKNAFQKAKGETEFYMDGTFVPILNPDRVGKQNGTYLFTPLCRPMQSRMEK